MRPPSPSPSACSQATFSGFGFVNSDNVFRVCDQPHPKLVAEMVGSCIQGNIDAAYIKMKVKVTPGRSSSRGCGVLSLISGRLSLYLSRRAPG
jgi:hypothetical protein